MITELFLVNYYFNHNSSKTPSWRPHYIQQQKKITVSWTRHKSKN